MVVGAPVWGSLSDARGRKLTFGAAVVLIAVFGFASAVAPNFATLIAFRTLVGFAVCVRFSYSRLCFFFVLLFAVCLLQRTPPPPQHPTHYPPLKKQ